MTVDSSGIDDAFSAKTVNAFLGALEGRDIHSAAELLANDVELTYPGGRKFSDLNTLVASSKQRYQWVKKDIESFDLAFAEDSGVEVVYVRGTLYGVNLSGVPFQDIRFIDRFELIGGKITKQDVWNDLAESNLL